MRAAEQDWYADVLAEQLEVLHEYCLDNFYQFQEIQEENEYDPFPKFNYIGSPAKDKVFAKKDCLTVILNDEAVIEGITIYFTMCCQDEIGKVVRDLYAIANEVIDFSFLLERERKYLVINPDYSFSSDSKANLIPEFVHESPSDLDH